MILQQKYFPCCTTYVLSDLHLLFSLKTSCKKQNYLVGEVSVPGIVLALCLQYKNICRNKKILVLFSLLIFFTSCWRFHFLISLKWSKSYRIVSADKECKSITLCTSLSAGNKMTNGQKFSLWKFNKLVLSWHCKLFTTKILYIYHPNPAFAWF